MVVSCDLANGGPVNCVFVNYIEELVVSHDLIILFMVFSLVSNLVDTLLYDQL